MPLLSLADEIQKGACLKSIKMGNKNINYLGKEDFNTSSSRKMKKGESVVELFLGIIGIVLVLVFHNQWGFIPIILWGIVSSLFIRRRETEEVTSLEKRNSVKRRNIILVLCWVLASIICFYATNDVLRTNGLWFLLSSYMFLSMHGLVFLFPIGFFPNEKKE